MMNRQITALRDQILDQLLPAVPPAVLFNGWTWKAVEQAAAETGLQSDIPRAVFPDGLQDAVAHFSDLTDRQMLVALGKNGNTSTARIHDRIEQAVWTRLNILSPHRDIVRQTLAYWSIPPRPLMGSRVVWRTADRIWIWAGDTPTEYNRHAKRGILAGILTATELSWLKDESDGFGTTRDFLRRRIENALQFGSIMGRLKSSGQTF